LDSRVELPVEGKKERRGAGEGKKLLMVMRSDLDDAERAKRAECKQCRYDAQCEGVWKNYLARFGWDEFSPVLQSAAE
jgi:cyclic pyranopterin phosphate synthase